MLWNKKYKDKISELELEVKELKLDVKSLVLFPEANRAMAVYADVKIKYDMEKCFWEGRRHEKRTD